MDFIDLLEPLEFEWDEGNKDKNWLKHQILTEECEQVFTRNEFITFQDAKHSFKEPRYVLFGKNDSGIILTIAFTIRHRKIRIISARSSSNKESIIYEEETGFT